MKKWLTILLTGLLMGFGSLINAQQVIETEIVEEEVPPPEWSPPDGPQHHDAPPPMNAGGPMGFDRPGPPHDAGFGRPQHPNSNADRSAVTEWLNRLRANKPEEYERMKQMKEEDPERFHSLLRSRVQRQRFKQAFKEYPVLRDAYGSLSADDQKDLVDALYKPPQKRGSPNRAANRAKKQKRKARRKNINNLDKETHIIARKFQNTEDEQEQQLILIELRTKLEEQFAIRNRDRLKQIEALEGKLTELKDRMALRESQQEEIINRRIEELTQHPDLKW